MKAFLGFLTDLVGTIQRNNSRRMDKTQRLRRELHELERSDSALLDAMARADRFDPGNGDCPRCAIDHDLLSKMVGNSLASIDPNDRAIERRAAVACERCGWVDAATKAADSSRPNDT